MELERQLKIKNAYCGMIIDVGLGYDGYESSEDLKRLIDELLSYARMAIDCDDKSQIFIDAKGNKLNILDEVI